MPLTVHIYCLRMESKKAERRGLAVVMEELEQYFDDTVTLSLACYEVGHVTSCET